MTSGSDTQIRCETVYVCSRPGNFRMSPTIGGPLMLDMRGSDSGIVSSFGNTKTILVSFMGLPFGLGGLRNLHCSPAGNPAPISTTRRRTQPACPFNLCLGSLQTAARGQVRSLGHAGAAGGFSLREAVAVLCHGASLFFLSVAGIANRYESQFLIRASSQ